MTTAKFRLLLAIAVVVCAGCSQKADNIFGCPARLARPEMTGELMGTVVDYEGADSIFALGLSIMDTVVVASGMEDWGAYIFDSRDWSCKGAFIAAGRGPHELLSPVVSGFHDTQNGKAAYILDLETNAAYDFLLVQSMESGVAELTHLADLPNMTTYSYPYKDSLHFAMAIDSDSYDGYVLDGKGKRVNDIVLYNVPGMDNYDKLLSSNAIRPSSDRIAMAMRSFPQINFLDIDTGERKTVAVDASYKKWQKDLAKPAMDLTTRYADMTVSDKYVIALYQNASLTETLDGEFSARIHVFSWDGDFLCDFSVPEKLQGICFDSGTGILYGLDDQDAIYKYPLTESLTKI